ncbi:hypothetical protein [Kineosporia sp. R_H_3]|uniref:hypothetical protein n=1 Tax=Kineosporia sp. R_H_3 TaxID=1961848 RepID=UPI000B4BDF92|nr:hypothetical protein [Kineosporia sp. R_H_3]
MRRYTTAGVDGALAGLARALDELREDVRALSKTSTVLQDDVASHTRALATLAQSVAGATSYAATGSTGGGSGPTDGVTNEVAEDEEDGDPPGVAWLTVTDPAQAVAWLSDLALWVPAVWQPHLQTRTPGCWPWHPAVVAELLVVRHVWHDAIQDADPAALAAWHDRWRPSAMQRVGRLMGGCERAEGHHKIGGLEHTYDTSCLDELAVWWATTHGTDRNQPPPGISKEGTQW